MEEVPLVLNTDDDVEFEMAENDYLLTAYDSPSRRNRRIRNWLCCFCFCAKAVFWSVLETMVCNKICGKKPLLARTIWLGKHCEVRHPPNVIKNQKYNVITFVPMVLYNQFKFFLNLFFLIMACSQFIPQLRIGLLYTYWSPLCFVLSITMFREAFDDFLRYQRDKEINHRKYKRLTSRKVELVRSCDINVGDLIVVQKDERVPADMVLLRTTEKTGSCFIRTDQLDGETDWKLRLAIGVTQKLESATDLFQLDASVYAEKPQKDIHSFIGTFTRHDGTTQMEDSLGIDNTLWANTVVASGTAVGIVIYTGCETRSVMNNSQPRNKVGLLDLELNRLTKVLFVVVILLALLMMILKGWNGPWYVYFFRFVLLFSYIIPLSLRVNLDMSKMVYAWFITKDQEIPGTVVRSTTIPEELGRVSYLLTDKTGTLTQNEMVFRRLHLGTVAFGTDTFDEVCTQISTAFQQSASMTSSSSTTTSGSAKFPTGTQFGVSNKMRRTVVTRVNEAVKAIALCHNVTPVSNNGSVCADDDFPDGLDKELSIFPTVEGEAISSTTEKPIQIEIDKKSYQASSPDEVALVSWAESVGLMLNKRNLHTMQLKGPNGKLLNYQILQIFPFTSESKRMGIILKEDVTNEITFYIKGADVIMNSIVQYNDWLEEECCNMAREGLRTLVVAKKILTEEQYIDFESRYQQAKVSIFDRAAKVEAVRESLERDMELLCLTGVEDKLQENVRPTLEMLRNAGIKIWMLTGDKLETAASIATSSRLVTKEQTIHVFKSVSTRTDAHLELNAFRRKNDCALIIKGDSLEICLKYYEHEFMELACQSPAVVCCRCSPTQKADVVKLIQQRTMKRTCAIGDGGNDVSMIQQADVGVGIVGKEGKQASLAADFSILQFCYIAKLLLVHGRNSYKRSASLSQFVIHRGLIITVMQAIFSSVFYFVSIALYQGVLVVGYATVYTMFPVFSLVLDKDVSSKIALTYPEVYQDLTKGRSLSFRTFFVWVLISLYQGGVIMYGAFLLFEDEFLRIVSISFTALILTELLMVALTVRTWHYMMVLAELLSLLCYLFSLLYYKEYFDQTFLATWAFVWKVCAIVAISCLPLYIIKFIRIKFSPPSYTKLQ